MAGKFSQVFVVSNTHWDREFRSNFQHTRILLVRMMDMLLYILENDPEYESFTLDSHAILVEDYLEIRPENRERIKKLVRNKRLFVGPWYTLPDIPNIGAEAVVRNLIYGHKVGDELGHTMKVGYTPCSWGQTGQLPQIYAGFGIDTALFYRGISPHEANTEFIWEAPDGTRVLAHRFSLYARYNYYYLVFRKITYGFDPDDRHWNWGEFDEQLFRLCDAQSQMSSFEVIAPEANYKKEAVVPSFKEMMSIEGDSYVSDLFLGMFGHDISFPFPLETQIVKEANEGQQEFAVKNSNLEEYMSRLKKSLDLSQLQVLKGERRGNLKEGKWTYLFPATISARSYLKIMDFETENLLVEQIEPLMTFASLLGMEYPRSYLELAWRYLLTNHTHDAHTGCAADEVIEDVEYRYQQSQRISHGLSEEGLKFLASNINGKGLKEDDILLLVFNPSPQLRSEVAEVEIDVPEEEEVQSLVITDEQGIVIDYQLKQIAPNWRFVDNIWNVPHAYSSKKFHLKLNLMNIPPVGYKVYNVGRSAAIDRKSGSLITGQNVMENEFLRVTINPNGTWRIEHKATGHVFEGLGYFQDQGEVGNAWAHQAPAQDEVITSMGANARIGVAEDGTLSATFRVDINLKVPKECPDPSKRSGVQVDLPITNFITLNKGSKVVEVKTSVDNNAKDHWLRVVFPTNINTSYSYADSHFDVVKRPISVPKCDDWKEPAVGTFPFNSFVTLSNHEKGLAIIGHGLKEFEVFDQPERPIAISLIRGVKIKLEVSEQKKQELPDLGPQCLGRQEFRYAIYPYFGHFAEAELFKLVRAFNVPLRIAQLGRSRKGKLPWQMSLFERPPQQLIVTALKRAERNNDVILRLFNPTDRAIKETVIFSQELSAICLLNLNEEPLRELISGPANSVDIEAGPKKIITLGLKF